MTFEATIATVMLSGPSDTADDVDQVRKAVREWNAEHAVNHEVVYITKHYKSDAVPLYTSAADGQIVINEQLTNKSDIIFARFRYRLGSPTPRNPHSGTVEEVEALANSGKPAHVYFWNGSTPYEVTAHEATRLQHQKLIEFRSSFGTQARGLYTDFADHSELRDHIKRALTDNVPKILAEKRTIAPPPPATTEDRYPLPIINITGEIWRLPDTTFGEMIKTKVDSEVADEEAFRRNIHTGQRSST